MTQVKAKCAFAMGRQVSTHTFSGCKLQPLYVKLHDPSPVKSRTYMYIFEVEETAAEENVAFDSLKNINCTRIYSRELS